MSNDPSAIPSEAKSLEGTSLTFLRFVPISRFQSIVRIINIEERDGYAGGDAILLDEGWERDAELRGGECFLTA